MKNSTEIYGMFPNPVASINERSPTKKELSFVENLNLRRNQGNSISQERNVLEHSEMKDLKRDIQANLDEFFHFTMQANVNCGLRITQSWCNYNNNGEFHHKHCHPNSAISGVYYIQAEHPDDRLMFHSPLEAYAQMQYQVNDHNIYNSKSWWLPAQTGTLFLFPSYLVHSVPAIDSRSTTRISLSFNTFYTGELGDEIQATALNL